jgi:glycosyltransferase involved in cell wall biosynthesis
MNVLHLTHTDLRYDSRILKELEAIVEGTTCKVKALGVFSDENSAYSNRPLNADIRNISLFTKKLKRFPRVVAYSSLLIELLLRFFFSSIKFKPDVIHCHDAMVLPVGFLLKFFNGGTLIYDAHELESDKGGQSRALAIATLLIEKVCWGSIDYFISVSNSIIDWYNNHFNPKPAIVIMNSPILKQKVVEYKEKYPKDYFRTEFKIPTGSLVFVYVGLFSKGRSIETLVDVFSDYSINSHIVFVGYGELEEYIVAW